jgi:HEAT repeat protein
LIAHPPLLEEEGKGINMILSTTLALSLLTAQVVSTPADFIRPSGDSLQARYDDAIAQGRRGALDAFWIAYQMPVRTNTRVFSVDGIESVSSTQPERVAMFLLVRKADGGVDKLRIVNLTDDIRVHDRTVYWLGQPSGDENAALLLKIARSSANTQVRKDAVFWLGEEISRQAATGLESLTSNDPEVEIQKQAVFAISLRANDESIPTLERIAKTHPNAAVRQQAIFWLGQKKDVRVLDFFEQILKK